MSRTKNILRYCGSSDICKWFLICLERVEKRFSWKLFDHFRIIETMPKLLELQPLLLILSIILKKFDILKKQMEMFKGVRNIRISVENWFFLVEMNFPVNLKYYLSRRSRNFLKKKEGRTDSVPIDLKYRFEKFLRIRHFCRFLKIFTVINA